MLETQHHSLTLFKADSRGVNSLDWLDSRHTFSFGNYHNPQRMHHGCLRVINEDWIQPESGFATHAHRDMEIITYVISGELQHKDSMGNGSVIEAGCFQRMSAGTGIQHSEFNASPEQVTHLLQIWFLPAEEGIPPGYEEQQVQPEEGHNRLVLMVSPSGREGAMRIHQDVYIYNGMLEASCTHTLEHSITEGRKGWVQVVKGRLHVNEIMLSPGDGLAVEGDTILKFSQGDGAQWLLFDMV
jgi:quercetin 2,3-dioxygenase